MFRHWEFGRLRRRTLVVAAVTLAVVIGTGGLVLLFAARSLHARTPFFRVTDRVATGGNVIGTGLDLTDVPSSNLVSDASFEPLVFQLQLTVLDGDAQSLLVSSEEANADVYGEGFFNGAAIRVMSLTDQSMVLRKTATVATYGVNRIGGFQPVRLPADLPDGLTFLSFTQQGDTIIAAGQRGTLLVGLDTQTPVSVKTGIEGDLTGICAGEDDGLLACSSDGSVLFSRDAVTWTAWTAPAGTSLHAVATSGREYVAVGRDGIILVGRDGIMTRAGSPSDAGLYDVVCGDGRYLACGEDDTVLLSSSGLAWSPVDVGGSADWTCADYRDGLFAVAGSDGQVCLVDPAGNPDRSVIPGATDIADITFLSRRQLIVLDEQGRFFVSDDGGDQWTATELEPGLHADRIASTAQDRIVSAADDGSLGTSLLVNEISLDTPLVEGTFQAGDLVFLEFVSQRLPDSYLTGGSADIVESWSLSRPDAGTRLDAMAAPDGGTGCMMLTVTPEAEAAGEAAFLSQVLVGEGESTRFENGRLYTVEFWLRQEDIVSRKALVWLTGRFETVGAVIENVGNTWKKYNYTFLLPASASNARPGEIRLNIGIEGAGKAWIDAVWMGLTESRPGQAAQDFTDLVTRMSPAVLRFSFLGIGDAGTRSMAWSMGYGNESATLEDGKRTSAPCGSMETALRIADAAGAVPWLTVGPYSSDSEIRNLVEYLAGPLTETYGKLRMDNGTSHPWTDVFTRVYLEIRDPDNVMGTDSRRASFVNHIIDIVRQSAYYSAIRNQITFIDGMSYDAALMLSLADFHSSAMEVRLDTGIVQSVRSAYRTFYDASPRIMDRPSDANYELIRSISIRFDESSPPTIAAYMETAALGAKEGYSVQLLSSVPAPSGQTFGLREETAVRLAAGYLKGTALETDALDSAPESVTAYAFRSGDTISILLINHADQAYSFPLEAKFPLEDAQVLVYGESGQLVTDETMRRSDSAVDVLPGGVSILVVRDSLAAGK